MSDYTAILPQSVYNNALPIYKSRIDLCVLDSRGSEFAENFLFHLFKQKLQVQTESIDASGAKLQHLFFESRNYERTLGAQTLGIGYPLFLLSNDKNFTVAPLFIWPISIEPSQSSLNKWIIRSSKNRFVEANEQLLKQFGNYQAAEEIKKLIASGRINRKSLLELGKKLETELDIKQYGSAEAIIPTPGVDVIGAVPKQGALQWSGVIGLFPSQIENHEINTDELAEIFKPRAVAQSEQHHPFGLLPIDPYQATALHSLMSQKLTVVEGGKGSGKTHILTHLLTNILSNGQKCLVVSDSVEALKKVQKNLVKYTGTQHNYLIKDARYDKKSLLEIIHSAAIKKEQENIFNETDFNIILGQTLRHYHQLETQYQSVRQPIFGDKNRTELVGQYLKSSREVGKELLNSKLNPSDFSYTSEEYNELKNGILMSHILYEKVNTLSHPLISLHSHIFTERTKENAYTYVEHRSKYFIEKVEKLQKKFVYSIDIYSSQLTEYYDRHYREFAFRIKDINAKVVDNSQIYGSSFLKTGKNSLRIKSVFSSEKRAIIKNRKQIIFDYNSLQSSFAERPYFDFQFKALNQSSKIQDITEELEFFSRELTKWRKQLEVSVQEEIQRLNSRLANKKIHHAKEVSSLEKELEELLNEINAALLYKQSISNKMLTLPNCQKFLEELIDKLQDTVRNLRDFDQFFPWQRNWLNQTPLSQKVIAALAKVQSKEWTVAFDSWYFHQTMSTYYTEEMPRDHKSLYDFGKSSKQLQKLIPSQINHIQQKRKEQSLKDFRKTNRKGYDLFFSKNKENLTQVTPFADFMEDYLNVITDFLPILFTTLPVAQDICKNRKEYFDYVVFIEANQFLHQESSMVASSGKRFSIFSDPYLDNDYSLSELAKDNEAKVINLKNFYESSYTPQLVNESKESQQTGLIIENIEGRFKEKNGVNEVEAQHVLKLLKQIKPTPKRTLPSVGIITFTKTQRDSISTYLLSLKQQNSDSADKIRQLERNGMGVFFVEELYGLTFDILIVSLTFGSTSSKGRLGKKVEYLYSPTGTKAIKLLISNSLQKTFLINSIPKGNLEEFLNRPYNDGAFYLAQLLAHAEALKANDPDLAETHRLILWETVPIKPENSIFLQEVQRILRSYFEKGRVHRHRVKDGFNLPLSIQPLKSNQSTVIVQPDTFFAKTPYTSFDWELKQRQKLEEAGFVLKPIWSINWWKNAEQSARKLASRIIRIV